MQLYSVNVGFMKLRLFEDKLESLIITSNKHCCIKNTYRNNHLAFRFKLTIFIDVTVKL